MPQKQDDRPVVIDDHEQIVAGLSSSRPSARLSGNSAAARASDAFAPEGTPITLGLAGYAKVLCSAVFVSGREPAEAFKNSGFFLFPDEHRAGVDLRGRSRQETRAHDARRHDAHGEVLRRSGLHHPSAGSRRHLLHAGRGEDTAAGRRDAAVADGRRAVAQRRLQPGSTRARLAKAVDLAFADPEALTAAWSSSTRGRSSPSATCRGSRRTRSWKAGRWARA